MNGQKNSNEVHNKQSLSYVSNDKCQLQIVICMYILGISCYYHDSAAALLKNGKLIAAADEERFSRIKHDSSFPKKAIQFCLEKAKLNTENLDYVVFYEKPFLKFERLFLSTLSYAPRSAQFFSESMRKWFFDHLWIKSHIASNLKVSPKKLLFSEHHLSHAASAFYASPFKKAAILSIDGVGEWATTSWGTGNDTKIDLKEEIHFPHSLGLLYSVFTDFIGFEVNEGEYKVMGLAPYGKPKYVDKIYKLINIRDDGSFELNQDYFSYQYSLKGTYTKKFVDLFGQPNLEKKDKDVVIPYYADLAASIQYVLEEILIKIVNHMHENTKLDNLCYAGGVALNSSANWKIASQTNFKNIFIQPSPGDSGGALGCALWAYHHVLGNKRSFVMNHAYWGQKNSDQNIQTFFQKKNITYKTIVSDQKLIDIVAHNLSKGKVIGWVQGEFEWGPRALGHRSILADPRNKKMKDLVNKKVKFREGFRPFAPAVILEMGHKYFFVGSKKNQLPLHFMLYVVPVKKEYQKNLAAITHVDGTARPQFVDKNVNPLYYNLIKAFGKKTGISVLLNTSFNLKGEPIVNTIEEAYSTFMRSGIDMLVIDRYIIEKI